MSMNNKISQNMTNPGTIKLKQIMIVKVQTWKNSAYRIFGIKWIDKADILGIVVTKYFEQGRSMEIQYS